MRTEWKPYRNVMLCDAEPAPRRLGPERSLASGMRPCVTPTFPLQNARGNSVTLIGTDWAKAMVRSLGGEQALLDLFRSQTPWTTVPVIQSDGPHGHTIRSNWFFVSEQFQPDPHDVVCEICSTLIALSPDADACDAVDPSGQIIAIGDFIPWSKNMPRENIAAKARVAWNVAFRQILLARAATDSLTDYTQRMTPLVQRTERVFRTVTEKWIKGRRFTFADSFAAEANEIVGAVNALAYAVPGQPSAEMTAPVQDSADDDSLGALLTGVLGNLMRRLNDIEKAKGAATFAGSLAAQAREHQNSEIWRTSSSPPLQALLRLSERLDDVACILHELAHDGGENAIRGIVKVARKAGPRRSTSAAARHCRTWATRRFSNTLRALKNAFNDRGRAIRCLSRPIDESDSVYWPAREIAILVELPDLEGESLRCLDDGFVIGRQILGEDWPFRMVPIINGQILASLALRPSSNMPLPDRDFVHDWSEHVDQPLQSSQAERMLEHGIDSCHRISAILTCRGSEELHPEEEKALSDSVDAFKRTRARVAETAHRTELDQWVLVLDHLDQTWNKVVDEYETVKAGRALEIPFCLTAHHALAGQTNESATELATLRMSILQAECRH